MNKIIVLFVAIIVIVVGAFWLIGGSSQNEPTPEEGAVPNSAAPQGIESPTETPDGSGTSTPGSTGSTSTPSEPTVGTPATKAREFTLAAKSFEFSVKEIRVKRGETVRIRLTNEQGTHDLVIDEFSAKSDQLQAGQSDVIEFVANKAGTFEYYCSVGNHRAMGMVGKLIVE